MISYWLIPDITRQKESGYLWEMITSFPLPDWVNRLVSFLLYLIIGYLLIVLNNTFVIIRLRASMQTCFYLLLTAVYPTIHQLYAGDVATLTFVIALFFLFKTYQQPQASGYVFHSFLFIGLGSLVFPQITWLTPVLFIGLFNFQALTPQSFFAALIGWSLPYWFLLGHAFFYGQMEIFYRPFIELATFQPIDFSSFNTVEIITLGYYFILFAVSTIHSFLQSYKDKIRTRIYLRFFILLTFFLFLFILVQPAHYVDVLPLLLIGVSMLIGHMFVLTNSKASNFFFISTGIGLIALFLFNLWTLLWTLF